MVLAGVASVAEAQLGLFSFKVGKHLFDFLFGVLVITLLTLLAFVPLIAVNLNNNPPCQAQQNNMSS